MSDYSDRLDKAWSEVESIYNEICIPLGSGPLGKSGPCGPGMPADYVEPSSDQKRADDIITCLNMIRFHLK